MDSKLYDIPLPKLRTGETNSKREERKSSSRALKVQMNEFDASDNISKVSIDDEVAIMSRKLKQMMKMKGKF